LRALPAGQSGRRGTEAGPVRGLRRAERRKQILDAATQAFARSGFVTTSLDEVAAEAGITHVILYRRFDCKAGMYRAVRDHPCTRLASTAAPNWLVCAGQTAADQRSTAAGWQSVGQEVRLP